ncbi:MAG: hypothetical protein P4L43_00430 [Syntrophobacteraceae bacterium]|nr:hypothetical protein [Syntrophobacteraceae bacterium]
MKKVLFFMFIAGMVSIFYLSLAKADEIQLNVDAAPNAYGSSNYSTWWSNAENAIVNGTFVNMANGYNPANVGTTNFEVQDATVYSFGNLGSRLTFTYYIPDTTISDLEKTNFALSFYYQWGGVTHDYYAETYGSTWLQPSQWVNYEGGVIGNYGFAWWGAQNTNTQAELDSDLFLENLYQGNMTLEARYGAGVTSLTAYHTAAASEPSSIFLVIVALLGFAIVKRKYGTHGLH